MIHWITLCSQSGKEIVRLSEELNRTPSLILTNRVDELCRDFHKWNNIKRIPVYQLSPSPSVEEYREVFDKYNSPLITLHGYLKIIPKEICKDYNIYNGHPGLITKYPELRGRDPQERAFNRQDRIIGSVVHKVIDRIDKGEILSVANITLSDDSRYSREAYYNFLRETSIMAWKSFLNIFQ